MLTLSQPWPRSIPRRWKDAARLVGFPQRSLRQQADDYAQYQARKIREKQDAILCGGASYSELLFVNTADFSAVASTNAEASLLGGAVVQPVIPAGFLLTRGRTISLVAKGVFSTTGTPTLIFQWRIDSTGGSATLSGTSVGVSAAITTINNSSGVAWESRLDLVCRTPGIGTGNATLAGAGWVKSPTGFASPFEYVLEPTTPPTSTWTATVNAALQLYCNLSCTWSANSASNTILLKHLSLESLN